MSAVTTPAVLLRAHPYSESSQILRFHTEALGVVGVMARGARARGGKGGGGLPTFAGGALTLFVKETRELQTMRDFAVTSPRSGLARGVLRFAAASVVGELVLRHAGAEGNPPLHRALGRALDRLEGTPEEEVVRVLLAEGWGLVATLGYHPMLDACAECGRPLDDALARFDFSAGGVVCGSCVAEAPGPRLGPLAREQLASLLDRRVPEGLRKPRAQLQLLSDFVTYHVSGAQPLRSFPVLAGLLPPEPEDAAPPEAGEVTADA